MRINFRCLGTSTRFGQALEFSRNLANANACMVIMIARDVAAKQNTATRAFSLHSFAPDRCPWEAMPFSHRK